ncbi:MAG: extracellular solute-binding protein, partial [Nitrospira sp.]|nr:extracellular solute-binding protein [Nitrospira sp.]
YPFVKEDAFVKDSWKAVPWFWLTFPGLYREDLFEQAGLPVPQSWEDVLNAGRVLKKQGHPVGIPISQCGDGNTTFWSILWGFGGKVLEADGKTLALNSPETAVVLEYYKNLYQEAMEPEVLSWNNASNNRFLVSGKGSWIHNAISAYLTALDKKMAVVDKIGIHSTPAGPAGRYVASPVASLGIWKFSKNQELAKTFLRYLLQPENYTDWLIASKGFSHAPLRMYEDHPIWTEQPKFKILPDEAQFVHARGWPSPPNAYIERIDNLFILPNMAAKVVTGTPVKTAIAWAEEQIRKILG